jgi:hypothetical protein
VGFQEASAAVKEYIMNDNLYNEIASLIYLGTEGEYWDFKEEWYFKKADLLHDIICMANNLANRDAYIIVGVSDSQSERGAGIVDISCDANRKNQQQMITFLRDKKFVGGTRPTVYIETLMFDDKQVDVIIVKQSNKTPYYLSEDFKEDGSVRLRASFVYTRIGDTNTPKDKSADLDKIECLWRKHFGIDFTVNERLLQLLDKPESWCGDLGNNENKYHSIYPEFQVKIIEIDPDDTNFDDDNSIVKNLVAHNSSKNFSVCKIQITCHTTILFSEYIIYLDGYRYVIPIPETDTIYIDGRIEPSNSLTYLYYDLSTVHGKLYNCLLHSWYTKTNVVYSERSYIVFRDKTERDYFNDFVNSELTALLTEYPVLLKQKGYNEVVDEDRDYFLFGWSKGNEIKAGYLFDKFRGKARNLSEYIFEKR